MRFGNGDPQLVRPRVHIAARGTRPKGHSPRAPGLGDEAGRGHAGSRQVREERRKHLAVGERKLVTKNLMLSQVQGLNT